MGFVKAEGDWVFQNLREFNIALFAKQCWRLIHDPNSLWARVLKDRYFPNIMSGDQTRIWVDRWLPNIPIGHPIPILGISMDANQSVSSIIQPDFCGWQWESIEGIISMARLEAISLTHVGNSRVHWRHNKISSREDVPPPQFVHYATNKMNQWSMFFPFAHGRFKFGLKDRCKTIFNRKHPPPIRTIHAIVGDVELFLKAKALAHIPSVPHSQTPDHRRSCTPPPPHMLKINVDVSCKTGCGRGAVGVVMMDYLGRCLAVKSKEKAAQSVYVVEAMAVIEGCLLAHQQNLSQVVVESNCKHIITCLLDNMENAH
ncbi:hypothetical protein ACFX2I_024666 [Malus domestica]